MNNTFAERRELLLFLASQNKIVATLLSSLY
jgi:hypothetical protein